MKKIVYAGIRKYNDGVAINYTYNYPSDLIYIEESQLYETVHNNDISKLC